jgi:hypothetical protein
LTLLSLNLSVATPEADSRRRHERQPLSFNVRAPREVSAYLAEGMRQAMHERLRD